MASAPRKRLQTTETNKQKRIRMDIRNELEGELRLIEITIRLAKRREWDRAKKRATTFSYHRQFL